jgi:DNA-binding response OmpR family regulator
MSTENGKGGVLVVEDDAGLNELVGAYVELAGFEYRRALDGNSAIAEVQRRRPTLIVLDIMLPDIDGFEVCRQLKADKSTRQVPVVMLTALSQDENRRKGIECGAAAYMTKPFDPDKLMAAIKEHANGT